MADFPSGKKRMKVLEELKEGLDEFRESMSEIGDFIKYADEFTDAVEENLEKCEEYFEEVREADDVEEFRIGLERWISNGIEFYGQDMTIRCEMLKEVLEAINTGFDSVAWRVVDVYGKTEEWDE